MAKIMQRSLIKMLSCDEMTIKNVKPSDNDNLDDWVIDNQVGELIIVMDNDQSDVVYKSISVKVKATMYGGGGGLHIGHNNTFPDNELTEAPTVMEWCTGKDISASEVRCINGIIFSEEFENNYLIEAR